MIAPLSGPFADQAILQPLLSMVLSALVVMGSPGPATISAAAAGAAFGARRSMAYLSGLILGTGAALAVVATGLVSLLQAQPQIAPVLLVLSAGYMLFLAYRIATAAPLPALVATATTVSAPGFMVGFLLAASNPKAYIALSAVFGGNRLGMPSMLAEAVIKFLVLAAMIVFIQVCWLYAGTVLARLLREPVAARIVNLLFAGLLVATTVAGVLPG